MTLSEMRAEVAARLGSAREARWLVDHVLGSSERSPAESGVPTDAESREIEQLVARRRAGEPLQYVLGEWSFRQLDLAVDQRALIPRPETEQLVELALHQIETILDGLGRLRIVDLGTGTGAIALSLAAELYDQQLVPSIWAVDDDSAALALARRNLDRLAESSSAASTAAQRVHLRRGHWWAALPTELRGEVQLAVSNPPYVAEHEWEGLEREVRNFEPRHALVAEPGPDGTPGMAAIAEVIRGAPQWLAHPGVVLVELAPEQADPARLLAQRSGFDRAEIRHDLAGRARFLEASFGGETTDRDPSGNQE